MTRKEILTIVTRILKEADEGKKLAGLTQVGAKLFYIGDLAHHLFQSLQHDIRDAKP